MSHRNTPYVREPQKRRRKSFRFEAMAVGETLLVARSANHIHGLVHSSHGPGHISTHVITPRLTAVTRLK